MYICKHYLADIDLSDTGLNKDIYQVSFFSLSLSVFPYFCVCVCVHIFIKWESTPRYW